MNAADEPVVVLPLPGTAHAHTGCFHVECPLPGGLVLWLLGGSPPPRTDHGRVLFHAGQTLAGFVRPVDTATDKVQADLEHSGALAGLPVEWVELPFPDMRRWFQFRAGPALLRELLERLRSFSSPVG